MKDFYKRAALLILSVTISLDALAGGFSVRMKFIDAKSGAGVEYATVSLTKQGSDKVLKYTQTDSKGNAALDGIPEGVYVLKGILLGYNDYSGTVEVRKDVNLGELKMSVSAEYLKGAVVTDVGNPIVVKKDTIEHNVSLMHSSDNDVLEDLLKRVPGVEVNSDGTITANGKTVSKIQIEGKEFFTNDPSLASKNLPAKIVEKVRVVEKKSDQARFTGIDDGEEETVLDLGIKKGMMNGWLGNFSAGGGMDVRDKGLDGAAQENDFRYQGAGLAANFTDNSQLAFVGNINNTNNRGFQDMMASTMGGMRGGGMRGGDNNGISNSFMVGGNGGYTFKDKSEVVANAMGNGNRRYVEESTARTTYNSDGSSLFATEDGTNYNNTYGIRAGGRAEINLSENASLIIEPGFRYGWGDYEEKNLFATDKTLSGGGNYKVNDGNSLSTGKSNSVNADGRIVYRQKLGKPGRTLSVNARYQFSDTKLDGSNYSLTNAYEEPDQAGHQAFTSKTVDQQFNQKSNSNSINARLAYTEPLGKNFYLEANYRIRTSRNNSVKDTYDKDDKGQYTRKDDLYSSNVTNRYMTHIAGLSLMKQEEKYNLTIGATIEPNKTVNETRGAKLDTSLTLKVLNWSPNARFDYNFTDHKMLRINYRGNSTQPSINQLMPIPDNSNPQRQVLGNMELNPSFNHELRMMYRGTSMENFSSIHAELNGNFTPRSIVNATWTNAAGVQYSVPMNYEKPTYSANGMFMFNSPIGKSKFSLMSFTRLNYGNGVSFVGDSNIDPQDKNSYLNLDNYTSNRYQNVSANENLRLTYRRTIWEASVGGEVRYSQAFYEISEKNRPATWTNGIFGNVVLNSDIISLSTDVRYTFYKGYSEGYNDPTLVWNAEISKQLLKNRMTIAVKAYDILNQSKNTFRTTTDNYVLDTRNNTLGRYVILTITYRFGSFGGKKMMGMGGGPGPSGQGGPGGMRPGAGGPPMGGGRF
ncbi:MAG: outer membrane beta-barrel protein [Bacteroidales bacterium]|nr:outer membrane beta-barrel protein [Bacteroidales bacterium]